MWNWTQFQQKVQHHMHMMICQWLVLTTFCRSNLSKTIYVLPFGHQFFHLTVDMSDDVYGHSVEDYDIAVSPTTGRGYVYF